MKNRTLWIAVLAVMLLDFSSCWVERSSAHYYKAYDRRHEHDRYYRQHNR